MDQMQFNNLYTLLHLKAQMKIKLIMQKKKIWIKYSNYLIKYIKKLNRNQISYKIKIKICYLIQISHIHLPKFNQLKSNFKFDF